MRAQDFLSFLLQVFQYVVVGGIAFVVDIGLMVAAKELLSMNYIVAATLSFSAGLCANYFLCLAFVFSERVLKNARHEFAIFLAVGLAGLVLNALLLWVFVSALGYNYISAKLLSAGIVLIFNFGLRRQLLFNPTSSWARLMLRRSTAYAVSSSK